MKQPTKFGKYYLLERINIGGMAEVFKAKSFGVEGFEKMLAIKRILPNIAEDEDFITMFIDEAKISVQLNHANIAQIYDLGKIEDSYFIALEYVSGKDLRTIWDRHKKRSLLLPIPMSVYVMSRTCEGLDYAHRKKDAGGKDLHIVHRDVSPQNVLISYEGEVKIIDFGIAKAANKASKTQAGILKGKFGYMSPEQVRGLPLDRRSDIFAVGIILYELLTGERLFVGESDFSTLEKVRNVEILPPTTYNRKIPDTLEKIVLKALSKDPDDRYQSSYDMQEDLQRFLIMSGTNFARKDLANYMKRAFRADIQRELKRQADYQTFKPGEEALETASTDPGMPAVQMPAQPQPPPPPTIEHEPPPPLQDLPEPPVPSAKPSLDHLFDIGEEEEDEDVETVVFDARSGVLDGVQTSPGDVSKPMTPKPVSKRSAVGSGPKRSAIGSGPKRSTIGSGPKRSAVDSGPKRSEVGSEPRRSETGSRRSEAKPGPRRGEGRPGSRREGRPGPRRGEGRPVGTRPPRLPKDRKAAMAALPDFDEDDEDPTTQVSEMSTLEEQVPVPAAGPSTDETPFDFGTSESTASHEFDEQPGKRSRLNMIIAGLSMLAAIIFGLAVFAYLQKAGLLGGGVTLTVRATPPDAKVFLDGQVVGQFSPNVIQDVAAGTHVVEARRSNYQDHKEQIEIASGEDRVLDIAMKFVPASIELVVEPADVVVKMDGKLIGNTSPIRRDDIFSGVEHIFTFERTGYQPETRKWTFEPKQKRSERIVLKEILFDIKVNSDPEGASVYLDDARQRSRTPMTIEGLKAAKTYQLEIRHRSYPEWRSTIRYDGQPTKEVMARLRKTPAVETDPGKSGSGSAPKVPPKRRPKPKPKGKGLLKLNSKPWGRVWIDGKDIGRPTPLINYELPAGKHRVTIHFQNGTSKTVVVDIKPDETTKSIVEAD